MSISSKAYTESSPIACPFNLHDSQLSPQTGEALALGSYLINNASGSAVDVGLFARFPNNYWEAGIITAASTPDYQGESTGAKSTTANAFANVFTTTNNDGFLISCVEKFSAISFVVDNVAGGSPVFAYKYYDGSSMTAVTPIASAVFGSTGKTQALFFIPSTWTKGTTAAVGGDSDKYSLQITASTAPSDACNISDVRVYKYLDYFPSLPTNNQLLSDLSETEIILPTNASVATYFSGTPSGSNFVYFKYRAISRQV